MSLVESLLILPAHLSSHAPPVFFRPFVALARPFLRAADALRRQVDRGLQWFVRVVYHNSLEWALEWRYTAVAIGIVTLLLAVGVAASGLIKFTFLPRIDSDTVTALVEMPQGTPVERTTEVVRGLERAILEVGQEMDARRADSTSSIVHTPSIVHTASTLGEQPSTGAQGPIAVGTTGSGGHLAEVVVELVPGEERDVPSGEVMRRWRERVGEVPGASALTFSSAVFSAGDAISVRLAHRDFDVLQKAADELKSLLTEYPGTTDITDSFVPGKRELELELTEEGRALGLTLADLARDWV